MATSSIDIGYVVFFGRKCGVFSSWIDAYAQVNGFKEGVVRVYDTFVEAEAVWKKYCSLNHNSVRMKTQIEELVDKRFGYVNDILSTINNSYGRSLTAISSPPNDSLMNLCMQKWLSQACIIMRIHQPYYALHDKKFIDGKRYYKYRCSLTTDVIGRPPVSVGGYADSEEQAREDVAVLMLRRLLSSTGKRLGDYNSHNVELLEKQLLRAMEINLELKMENATLLVELELLRKNNVTN